MNSESISPQLEQQTLKQKMIGAGKIAQLVKLKNIKTWFGFQLAQVKSWAWWCRHTWNLSAGQMETGRSPVRPGDDV